MPHRQCERGTVFWTVNKNYTKALLLSCVNKNEDKFHLSPHTRKINNIHARKMGCQSDSATRKEEKTWNIFYEIHPSKLQIYQNHTLILNHLQEPFSAENIAKDIA